MHIFRNPGADVDLMSRRATRVLNGLVAMSRFTDGTEITVCLPLSAILVRVCESAPTAAERSQARIVLADREPGVLALVLHDVAYGAAPAVRGYYRAHGETIVREWFGDLAITPAGEVMIVAPNGQASVISAEGLGLAPTPFKSSGERLEAFARAAAAWRTQVVAPHVREAA